VTSTRKRPFYLNLIKIRLPVAGVMSIMHRLSGLFLALVTPALIYLLDLSLDHHGGFDQAHALLGTWLGRAALFVLLWALMHHLLAGIRYLLLDIDIGIDKPRYRHSAWAVIGLAPLLALLLLGGLQ
jgi:succinate dehydrogenase / fumarate reductase cytochrome b subunit